MESQASWENRLLDLAGHVQHASIYPLLSTFTSDALLHESYRHAAQVTASYSRSFFFATRLLPKQKRHAVRALYAFCRTVDDIVDEGQGMQNQRAALDYWRQVVETASFTPGDLVAHAWSDALLRHHIPRLYALQLIAGVERDLLQRRYQTFDDLATYCYGVASTVGLMSMHIIGFNESLAVSRAIKLGVALQLTNILRDVGEDYRSGRLYLPIEELDQYGVPEVDIAAGRVTEPWRRFMRFQIQRARSLYEQSWSGIQYLNPEGRMAVAAASTFYEGILQDIEQYDYNVFTRRAHLTGWQKISSLPGIWLRVGAMP